MPWGITHAALGGIHHHQQNGLKENVRSAHCRTMSAWQRIFWSSLHRCWVLASRGSSSLFNEGLCHYQCHRERWSEGKYWLWENTNRVLLHIDSSRRQIKVFWWEHSPVKVGKIVLPETFYHNVGERGNYTARWRVNAVKSTTGSMSLLWQVNLFRKSSLSGQ